MSPNFLNRLSSIGRADRAAGSSSTRPADDLSAQMQDLGIGGSQARARQPQGTTRPGNRSDTPGPGPAYGRAGSLSATSGQTAPTRAAGSAAPDHLTGSPRGGTPVAPQATQTQNQTRTLPAVQPANSASAAGRRSVVNAASERLATKTSSARRVTSRQGKEVLKNIPLWVASSQAISAGKRTGDPVALMDEFIIEPICKLPQNERLPLLQELLKNIDAVPPNNRGFAWACIYLDGKRALTSSKESDRSQADEDIHVFHYNVYQYFRGYDGADRETELPNGQRTNHLGGAADDCMRYVAGLSHGPKVGLLKALLSTFDKQAQHNKIKVLSDSLSEISSLEVGDDRSELLDEIFAKAEFVAPTYEYAAELVECANYSENPHDKLSLLEVIARLPTRILNEPADPQNTSDLAKKEPILTTFEGLLDSLDGLGRAVVYRCILKRNDPSVTYRMDVTQQAINSIADTHPLNSFDYQSPAELKNQISWHNDYVDVLRTSLLRLPVSERLELRAQLDDTLRSLPIRDWQQPA